MKPATRVLLSAVACGAAAFASNVYADPAPAAEVVGVTTEAGVEPRIWATTRESYDGPVLDAEWFKERRAIVYLVPNGGLPAMRGPAAAVIRDHWIAGDWSVKHVFVSSVPNRTVFAAGRRIGLYDLSRAVTKEAGQDESFVAANEDYVRQNVFFVHDPGATAWTELIGETAEGRRGAAVVLLDGGRVVKSIDVNLSVSYADEDAAARQEADAKLAAAVREAMPSGR